MRTRQDSIEFHQNLIEINCVCVECASDGGTVQILRPEQKSTGGANIGGGANICFSKVSEFRLKYLYFCSTPQIYAPHGHITKDMSILICVINIELVLN